MKKDIKYIIKRVISAILIILIVGSLKKCNVNAEALTTYYLSSTNATNSLSFSASSPCLSANNSNCYHLVDSLTYNNYNIEFYYYNYRYNGDYMVDKAISFLIEFDNKYYVFSIYYKENSDFDYTNIDYLIASSNNLNLNFPPNLYAFNNNNENLGNFGTFSDLNLVNTSSAFKYNFYELNFENVSYTSYGSSSSSLANNILQNGLVVASSSPYTLKYNDNEIYVPSPYPVGYEEISLTGTQSVYFVPKDYNDIQIDTIDNVNYIDFNYYVKGSITAAYFPLENMDDMELIGDLFSPEFTLVDSHIPMFQNPNGDAQGYQYYSYIIFNKNEVDSIIHYNSVLFDAYFIEDIQTYNEIICSINRDDEEICFDMNFSADFENAWLKGFQDDEEGFVGGLQEKLGGRVSGFFDILKFPFNWLKSMTQTTCSPLVLPIPFLNGSFQLPCLSSIYSSVLGDTLYNVIFYIINGFIIYRVSIANVSTIKGVLDPNDDKIEVIDL